jgi:hypothetical protein
MGHILSKDVVLVDHAKIVVIVNLLVSTSVQMLQSTLGHTGYYKRFIHNYSSIKNLME